MLELEGLRRRFGDVVALDGVALTARPGRLLGFLGPNGAGKSTTMRAVFGLVRLDAGRVTWRGAAITATERRRFGYLPEQRGLYPRMPVAEQIAYLGELQGLDAGTARASASRWLDELGLTERADTPLRELSHGNQQRIQLAAALVHEPDLLVLDEPLNGLDPLGVADLSRLIRERAGSGAAVVLSSHQLELVESLCDDIAIIVDGRIRLAGDLTAILAEHPSRTVEVRLAGGLAPQVPASTQVARRPDGTAVLEVPAGTPVGELLAQLAGQGSVERFRFEPPPLGEIFRATVGASIDELEAAGTPEPA